MRDSDEVNISGKASNYIAISDFTTSLLEKQVEDSEFEDPFTSVTLNAVSLDRKDNTVNFSLTLIYDPEVFTDVGKE